MSGTELMVFVKRITTFAAFKKDKMTGNASGLRLVFHFPHVTLISLSNTCSNDQTAPRQ